MGLPIATSALQKIDRWIGVPVCASLSLCRKLLDHRERPASGMPRNILFVKFAEQGSTVLASAAIRRAIEFVGRNNVYFVVFKENRFILDVMGLIPEENVIIIQHSNPVEMAGSALAALLKLRSLKLDAAVDMEFFSRSSAALTYLSGARRRAGFHTFFGEGPYRGDLMTHRLLYNPYLHTSQIFRQLVEALLHDQNQLPTFGTPAPELEEDLPRFQAPEAEIQVVRELLSNETGQKDPRIILLNPNASDLLPLRRWETERYIELAGRLLQRYPDAFIGMTGAPSESAAIANVVRAVDSKRCFSLAGKTTMKQLLILYTLCDLLITNDSGPAHFASLTPINVITLFGPETPSLFSAQTPRNVAIWAGIACSPCVNAYNNRQSPCQNNLCMQLITVDQVFAMACKVLEMRKQKV